MVKRHIQSTKISNNYHSSLQSNDEEDDELECKVNDNMNVTKRLEDFKTIIK